MIFDALDRELRERAVLNRFAGVVRITRGLDELFAGAYGDASRAWRVPNSLDMRFDTASVTKLFTAVAVLQQIDRGALALDTPAIPFLGLTDTTISPEVTVSHLLTHTSGIGDDADEEAGEDYAALWRIRPNHVIEATSDLLEQFIHKPPNFAPGQGCRYCNVGYVLLGLMVERCTGVAYRDYVRDQIFAPAGMLDSGFFRFDVVTERVAEGCDPIAGEDGTIIGWRRNIYSYPSVGSPDGGAHVTAADLDRFLRALQAGQLLSPKMSAAMLTPQVRHHDEPGWTEMYGYGLWFAVDPSGEVIFYQKEGYNAGVSAISRYYPAVDAHVVMLSNMADGVWEPIRLAHTLVMGMAAGE